MLQGRRFWRLRFWPSSECSIPGESPRIWFHAASVGEVAGALAVLKRLRRARPHVHLLLTVGTPQGYSFALREVPDGTVVKPAPMDLPWALKRAFRRFKPDLFVGLESEFWPLLYRQLRCHGTPPVLLNGRISERSFRTYRRFPFVFRPVFSSFALAAVKGAEDRARLMALGVPPEKIHVLGSAKYDGLLDRVDWEKVAKLRERLRLPPSVPVMVAGSLRRSECIGLLDLFLKLKRENPKLIGLFAPRHLDRVPQMVAWLQARGVAYELFSSLMERDERERKAEILIVDRIGHLFTLYGLGNLVFCGGSLEPVGGHNIVEPVVWGKVVYYGPHIQNVWEEHEVLSASGVGVRVSNLNELEHRWRSLLDEPNVLERQARRAEDGVRRLSGVADRQVDLLLSVLERHGIGKGGSSQVPGNP